MYHTAKRAGDLLVAGVLLVVTAPIQLGIAIAVAARMGRPVLFTQQRPGRGGRVFTMLKFRTMADAVDADGRPLPDRERVTGLGRFLRATSLDELPELWNVVRGDMSLVGPRPLLVDYLDHYTPRQAMRHRVRPGVTGWAQVSGRNRLSWDEKLEADAWYVEHISLPLDLRILGLTVTTVFRREGIDPGDVELLPPGMRDG